MAPRFCRRRLDGEGWATSLREAFGASMIKRFRSHRAAASCMHPRWTSVPVQLLNDSSIPDLVTSHQSMLPAPSDTYSQILSASALRHLTKVSNLPLFLFCALNGFIAPIWSIEHGAAMIDERISSILAWLSLLCFFLSFLVSYISFLATVCLLLICLTGLAPGGYLFSSSLAVKFSFSIVELRNDDILSYMPRPAFWDYFADSCEHGVDQD
jgi:hypothetical protein